MFDWFAFCVVIVVGLMLSVIVYAEYDDRRNRLDRFVRDSYPIFVIILSIAMGFGLWKVL